MKIKTTFLLLCFPILIIAQQSTTNAPGDAFEEKDEPVRQKIMWVSPGTAGNCQVWNFSHATVYNDRSPGNQKETGDEWLTGREKETLHHYFLSGDSLFCTGYENEMTSVRYSQPQLLLCFPIDYVKSFQEEFKGRGRFSDRLEMTLTGTVSSLVDGWGKLILPGGNMLENVFRVHTVIRSLRETAPLSRNFDIYAPVDDRTGEPKDSQNTSWIVESIYQWYVAGTRYPVFETQETRIMNENEPVIIQRSTFIYPAGGQEHYPENK